LLGIKMSGSQRALSIGGRRVSDDGPCLIVAELGANHNQDKQILLDLVDAAADAKVDAIKLQTYTAKDLVSDPERRIKHGPAGAEKEETIGALFDRLSVPLEWHQEIFDRARKHSLLAFSTPFSVRTAAVLAGMNVPAFKIAASDLLFLPLLSEVAAAGRPIIISAGKCTLGEVEAAYRHLVDHGAEQIAILHCVAQYPAPSEEMRLQTIPLLRQMFPRAVIGLSDHSIGIGAALGGIALGARI